MRVDIMFTILFNGNSDDIEFVWHQAFIIDISLAFKLLHVDFTVEE